MSPFSTLGNRNDTEACFEPQAQAAQQTLRKALKNSQRKKKKPASYMRHTHQGMQHRTPQDIRVCLESKRLCHKKVIKSQCKFSPVLRNVSGYSFDAHNHFFFLLTY